MFISKYSKRALTSSGSQNCVSFCFPSHILWGSNWISFHFFLTFVIIRFLGFVRKIHQKCLSHGQIAMEQRVYHFKGHNPQAVVAPIQFVLKHKHWKKKMPMSETCDRDVQSGPSPDIRFFMSQHFDPQWLYIYCQTLRSLLIFYTFHTQASKWLQILKASGGQISTELLT